MTSQSLSEHSVNPFMPAGEDALIPIKIHKISPAGFGLLTLCSEGRLDCLIARSEQSELLHFYTKPIPDRGRSAWESCMCVHESSIPWWVHQNRQCTCLPATATATPQEEGNSHATKKKIFIGTKQEPQKFHHTR